MFSRESDASKVALARLVEACLERNIALIDCQLPSPHLKSLGSISLPRAEFMRRLAPLVASGVPNAWQGGALRTP
jgi:leucyl/phenylalanyl-tRNA--protein transferase